MINPDYLSSLWHEHRAALDAPIRSFSLPRNNLEFADTAYQMGVINLSRDSSYRESICLSVEQALYRARRMRLEGAVLIDVGAESTGDLAERVDAATQGSLLWPVLEALCAKGIPVSIETYHPEVAEAALSRGAAVINLTGHTDTRAIYQMVARHEAGIIMCYTPGEHARDNAPMPPWDDLIAAQLEFFQRQIELATSLGVERIWVDPGLGFFNNLPDGRARAEFQIKSVLHGFRFRPLGWPICLTLPSPVAMFREEVRSAETCFAVLALLAKANIIRSHEAARVQPVLDWQTA